MYKQLFVIALVMGLAGCAGNKQAAENAYLEADALSPLELPEALQRTAELEPLYAIPEASLPNPAESVDGDKAFPPQFVTVTS